MVLRTRDVKVALIKHRKTSRQVAEAVGLSPASFSRLIHGHRRADAQLLERIERAIKAPPGPTDESTAGANQTPPAV